MNETCWICNANVQIAIAGTDLWLVQCAACGPYKISGSLSASQFSLPDIQRYRLSHWARQRNLDSREPPQLDNNTIGAIVAQLPDPGSSGKADILLVSFSKAFPTPGQTITFDPGHDYPMACARHGSEAKFHFRALKDRSFVEGEGNSARISAAGWDRVEKLSSTPQVSRTAFIAMHFSPEMLAMWEPSFGAAVRKAGFEPVLANVPQHNEQIDDRIVAGIKQSRFVIADVTGARTGVYFDAGFALGLGRPVIWTCKADRKDDMHFDTRQYNHILWKDAKDLQDQLYYRIVATI